MTGAPKQDATSEPTLAATDRATSKPTMLQRLSNSLHRRKKKEPPPNSQEAINKALIKQYGNPPDWAVQSNMQYAAGLRGSSRRILTGAEGLGGVAGAAGGGGAG